MPQFDEMRRRQHIKIRKMLMPSILVGCSTLLVKPIVATEIEADDGQRTMHVATDGVDMVNCGTSKQPCRSITQAIQNAASGDLILVGEGRYGDLNGNGIFGEVGEEVGSGPCFCLVEVNKPLKIRSKKGALRTIIDGAGTGRDVVGITASLVVFGALDRGFTVTGSSCGGIAVAADEGVTLMGNVAESNRVGGQSGDGFEIKRVRHHRLIGNVSPGNGRGFALFGDQLRVIGNIAVTNLAAGFDGEGSRYFLHNNAAYSNLNGFLLAGPDHRLIRNSAIGNRLFGIVAQAAQPGAPATVHFVIERSNIYGNNVDPNSPRPNCGVFATGADITATHNYWGSAEGPGPDPADFACSEPASEIFIRPFSQEEFEIRPSIELSGTADFSS